MQDNSRKSPTPQKVPDDGTAVVWGRYIATRTTSDEGSHIEFAAGPGPNAWPTAPFVRLSAESGELYLFGALLPDPLQLALPISTPGDIDTLVAAFAKYPGYELSADEADVLARWLAGDRDEFFWTDAAAAGLIHANPVGEDSAALQYMPTTVGLLRDLGRSPLFSPRSPGQLAMMQEQVVGSLNARPFGLTATAGWPTVRDGILFAEAATIVNNRHIDPKDAEARKAYFSGRQWAELSGYGPGGWQLERVVQSVARLASFTVRFMYDRGDGSEAETRVRLYHLVEAADVGASGGWIQLSEWIVTEMREGHISFYNRPTWRALLDRNEHAAKLWQWAESLAVSETPKPWAVFSSEPGESPDLTRPTPAVADVLNLREKRLTKDGSGWTRRRDIVRHIRADAADLMDIDPRYTAVVTAAKRRPGMWNLWLSKARVPGLAAPVDNSPKPCTASRADRVPRVAPTVYHESREVCTTSRAPEDDSGTAPSLEAENSISSLSVIYQSSKERAGTAAPCLSQDAFTTFWSTYPRQEQSHKSKTALAFAKLPADEQSAAIQAAEHVAAAVVSGALAARYTWLPENFLKGAFRDWQNGPPTAYLSDVGHLADVLEAGALAFGLAPPLVCYVCNVALTTDEQSNETVTTHDGHGWRHVKCRGSLPSGR